VNDLPILRIKARNLFDNFDPRIVLGPTDSVTVMALSSTRQRNAVSEGVALGLLMCDHDELPFNKVALDLAFARAFRAWSYSSRFRQVLTDLSHGLDGSRAMTRANARKHVFNLYWENDGRTLRILARGSDDRSLDADEVADAIDGEVPAIGWQELAELFLKRFERD